MTAPLDLDRARRRSRVMLVGLVGLVLGMGGLSFAAVPLYDLFCRITGFGGTTQVADGLAVPVLDRDVTVRLDSSVARDLPWDFAPEVRTVSLKVGEPALVNFRATNRSTEPTVGVAVYNVTPNKTGSVFYKVQCFCFDEQVLQPGQTVDMPVYFYVDPSIAEDRNLDDVREIVLSYTFFRAKSEGLDRAKEKFYEEAAPAAPEVSAAAPTTAGGATN